MAGKDKEGMAGNRQGGGEKRDHPYLSSVPGSATGI